MKKEQFRVSGMTCAACQANITRRVQKLDGVNAVNVSLLTNQMTVEYEEAALDASRIVQAVTEIGYGAAPEYVPVAGEADSLRRKWQSRRKETEQNQSGMKRRLIWSVVLLIPLMVLSMGHMVGLPMPPFFTGTENALIPALSQLLLTIPVIYLNRPFFTRGLLALFRRAPNMDSLVAVGSGAALIYGIAALYAMAYALGHGDLTAAAHYTHELYFESSAMILTLVTVGKYLEARSRDKTSGALEKLVDLAPETAVVLRGDTEQTIPAEQVQVGDCIVIRPGDRIPADGVVSDGRGYVNQSAITGESLPVEKNAGDSVISATVNQNGTFRFHATRVGNDTTLAQIIRLVEDAGGSKAPIARLADRISGIFVPIVMLLALITGAVWLLAGQTFEFALSCAISVLVISCPCALGLATPVAIMVGTGKAAEYGILIKSAESLETLHAIDTVVLDKTGTITSGHPAVTDIAVLEQGLSPQEFLAWAASLEVGSEHPLAEAVVERAREQELPVPAAQEFEAASGRGVRARINGRSCAAGNQAFLAEMGFSAQNAGYEAAQKLAAQLAKQGKTPLFFIQEQAVRGIIAVADSIRETSRAAIREMHQRGLHVVMLTGDNRVTAEAIRDQLGIQEVIADVLPAQKEACIRSLQAKGQKVAMVGDGINDAPALMRADVGIAIGAGTDVAIESADVVLMKDSLLDAVTAIDLSRDIIRNVRMNLFWAFFYNMLGIPIAAGALFLPFGLRLSPMIGAAAMSLSSVCVVTNALRLRRFRPRVRAGEQINQSKSNLTETEKGCIQMKKTLIVEGMMCDHCRMHVEKALAAVPGVAKAEVNLTEKSAQITLTAEVSDQVLMDAVTAAGYTVVSCKNE